MIRDIGNRNQVQGRHMTSYALFSTMFISPQKFELILENSTNIKANLYLPPWKYFLKIRPP